MNRKDKETVTCVTLLDGVEHRRKTERRVVYTNDTTGERFVRDSLKGKMLLSANNEYFFKLRTIQICQFPK